MVKRVEKSEQQWRSKLSADQFRVCRAKGTEPAFTGIYHDCKEPGLYRCACCGSALFASTAKFDSGSGWPSFYKPVSLNAVVEAADHSHGMVRAEIMCAACDAHLGHVFPDGPEPTGLRYCINSVSLDLDRQQK